MTTALPTILAEELDVEPEQIDIVLASVHEAYRQQGMFTQGTGGSTSIVKWWELLSKTGAVRSMLVQATANRWQVEPSECQTKAGQVLHVESGRKLLRSSRFMTIHPAKIAPSKDWWVNR